MFKPIEQRAENVSEWTHRIQMLGSKFRESALLNRREDQRAGILTLAHKLRNIRFIQGLHSDRIQTIVVTVKALMISRKQLLRKRVR